MVATKGYGISIDRIDMSCPTDMEPYIKAYKEELKEKDHLMWLQGQYFASALDATVCNSEIWRGKHGKAHEYIKKPILQSMDDETKDNGYTESNEETAVFEMKQRIKALRSQGLPESPI